MTEERRIATEALATAQKGLDDAKAKLEAIKEPVLEVGDYGEQEGSRFVVVKVTGDTVDFLWKNSFNPDWITTWQKSSINSNPDRFKVLGNIFDDLERNSKDLREFEIEHVDKGLKDPDSVQVTWYGSHLCIESKHFHLNFDQTIEFHQQLGVLIATQLREEAKKAHSK